MRLVVALGGNALLRRGEPITADTQRANFARACAALAPIAAEHELVIAHGNGPQLGRLALQAPAYTGVEGFPLDILDAQAQGMVGYLIMQELGSLLPADRPVATVLTVIEVDPRDPAFERPTEPIGPLYTDLEAARLADEKGWEFRPDGPSLRRVLASPQPKRIFGVRQIRRLLEDGSVVVCAGGGGVPMAYTDQLVPAGRRLRGVEAVIDKDLAAALLAVDLDADALLIITDVDAVYSDWGMPRQRAFRFTSPAELMSTAFAEGSMGPKVRAACRFVAETGRFAAIGSIDDAEALLDGSAGTQVTTSERPLAHAGSATATGA
jgi:carbamate kinase